MRANELLCEEYDPSKARIPHPEDLVLASGSAGARYAINIIKQMAANPQSISIKPDGKPALIWGRDAQGFALCDKHMFKQGILPRSPEQIAQVYAARRGGGREELTQIITSLWPQFEASLSTGFRGWLFGDLLYSETPAIQNQNYVFQPNTVVYTVPVASELGQRVAKSTSAIVVHTYFKQAPGKDATGQFVAPPGQHISQLPGGVNDKGALLIITDQFAVPPKVKIPPDLNKLESYINSNGALIDKLLNESTLTGLKIKDLPKLLQEYGNSRVRQRNFANFGNDFIQFLQSKGRVSSKKIETITSYLQENAAGYKVLCQAFIGIMRAKDLIVSLLDRTPAPLQAHINNEPGQEGYLFHTKSGPIKAVDRAKFSAANFED